MDDTTLFTFSYKRFKYQFQTYSDELLIRSEDVDDKREWERRIINDLLFRIRTSSNTVRLPNVRNSLFKELFKIRYINNERKLQQIKEILDFINAYARA